jgi:hypothetical protein
MISALAVVGVTWSGGLPPAIRILPSSYSTEEPYSRWPLALVAISVQAPVPEVSR